jgi:hypothetical protein
MADERQHPQSTVRSDDTFERHGPEPPENDSGPSPSVEERRRREMASAPIEREPIPHDRDR